LEDKNKGQFFSLWEKNKAMEEKNKGQIIALEEKNKGQMIALEEKNKGKIIALEEKIKTAKEEAKKEALERLFNIINQSEYVSAKKAVKEIPIEKDNLH
jgi:uncharacterized protein YecA (UPF0149 family)